MKQQRKLWAKLLALYLSLMVVVGMMPLTTFADAAAVEPISVLLTIDGHTHRGELVGQNFVNEKVVTVEKGRTVSDLIRKYLDENKVAYDMQGDSYLAAMHDLREKEYGDGSGWIYYAWENGKYIFPESTPINQYVLDKPTKIKFVYTIENYFTGYESERRKAKEIAEEMRKNIDKEHMSGRIAAMLFNTGQDIPREFVQTVRGRVQSLGSSSSVEEYWDTILAVLATGNDPYNAWGRNLIEEIGSRDILASGSIEDMTYGIAIENAAKFDMSDSKWTAKKLQDKLRTLQNPDGSFGEGTDTEKVIRSALVLSLGELDEGLLDANANRVEDYLALKMHKAGGLPENKEDGLATATVLLARADDSKDPMGRLSYRIAGNWTAGKKPSPFKSLADFYIGSKKGFKRDLLSKEIDPETTEMATLAMERSHQYFSNPSFAGQSLFKFSEISKPGETENLKREMDALYEEVLTEAKKNTSLSEETAYILKRMGEELTFEQVAGLESKVQLAPKNSNAAYKSVMAAVASGKNKAFAETITSGLEQWAESRFNSPFNGTLGLLAMSCGGTSFSTGKQDYITNKLKTNINYKSKSENGKILLTDQPHIYGGAASVIGDPQIKENYIANVESLLKTSTAQELKSKPDVVPGLVTALNVLGEDIFAAKYKTKDGKSLVELLKESDKTSSVTFFAVASYKLKNTDGSNIFRYSFEPSIDEKVSEVIGRYISDVELPGHIMKKYDDRDVSEQATQSLEKIKKKQYKLNPTSHKNDVFNLLANGQDIQSVDGHNLIDSITEKPQANRKNMNIDSLTILGAGNYITNPSHPENRETLRQKVLAIKEFTGTGTGKDRISDAGNAMIALAPYYKKGDIEVKTAIDGFLSKASAAMDKDGTIKEFGNNLPLELPYHSNDLALFVQGLIHLGIDPHTDERFIKNGKSVLDGLLSYEVMGGFKMKKEDTEARDLYTRAALTTLIDYKLFKEGKPLIYKYLDTTAPTPPQEVKYEVNFTITPQEAQDAVLAVTEKDKDEVIEKIDGAYKLKAGEYTVKASKDGYKPLEKDFTVSENSESHSVALEMEKLVEVLFDFDEATNTIKGYKTQDAPENLVIPSEIGGVLVKHIAKEAFLYGTYKKKINRPLKSLELPEGLETIGEMAFQGSEFTQITIPSTLKEIHGGFRLCKQLETVTFAPNSQLKILGKDTFFSSAIKEITLPDTVEVIGESAFHSSSLVKINSPVSLKEIGSSAFALTSMQEFTVPSGVEKLNFDSRGRQGNNGLFFRTFEDEAKQQAAFARVFDESGKADLDNMKAVVNPVEVTFKYVDKVTGLELDTMPSIKAVGRNDKVVKVFGSKIKPSTIEDGDKSLLSNYRHSFDYKAYTIEDARKAIFGNYFTKGSEWTFEAPEVPGYNKPSAITKTLMNKEEEVVFQYESNGQKHRLSIEGEGIGSNVEQGELPSMTLVELVITAPSGKRFKKLLVNDQEVQAVKEGLRHKYSFRIDKDVTVKAEYEEAVYEKELKLTVDKNELKLGEKSGFKVNYRGLDVTLPNSDIVFEYDPEILKVDENTGEVTAVGSGTVELTAKLKTDEAVKDSHSLQVASLRVTVRVEDVNQTEIDPVEVSISSLKVTEGVDYYKGLTFEKPVPFLAIKEAVKLQNKDAAQKSVLDCGDDGNWMKVIGGLDPSSAYGEKAFFMFAVNDKMANLGVGSFEIKEGDNIVVYVAQDWQKNDGYVYFEQKEYTVQAGEEVSLKLLKAPFDMNNATNSSPIPYKGATLLKNIEVLKNSDLQPILSDDNGIFRYTFAQEGEYRLSASKVEEGTNYISRPYAIVKVVGNAGTEKTITSVQQPAPITVDKGTAKEALGLTGQTQATLNDGSTRMLELRWTSESSPAYDANTAGTYVFTADYDLPQGVVGEKPEVKTSVTVREETPSPQPDPLQDILTWAKAKQDAIAQSYEALDENKDYWKMAELGKLGKVIKQSGLDFIKASILDESNNIKTDDPGTLAKAVLALRANGIDPENYYGTDLIDALEGSNPTNLWSLAPKIWALSSDDYDVSEVVIEESLQKLLDERSDEGLWDTGWGWQDSTGFALSALAPYYEDRPEIKAAVEKTVNAISTKQAPDGDITDNVNSLVMVANGLWSCDASYLTDPRLVKDGNTLLHALKGYEIPGEPHFSWKKEPLKDNTMATEQAFRGIISILSMRDNKGQVFDYRGTPKYMIDNDSLRVIGYEELSDITVQEGTQKQDLGLPTSVKLKLSDENTSDVQVTWDNARPEYDKDKAGSYIFRAEYELPANVIGIKPTVIVKVIVEEAPRVLESIDPVTPIEVVKGTSEEAAKAKLPLTTFVRDNKGGSHLVNLSWTVEGYDANVPAEYTAVATFDLPDILQPNPSIEQRLTTTIKVLEEGHDPGTQDVDKSELRDLVQSIQAENLQQDKFTPESFEKLQEALEAANFILSDDAATKDEVNIALDTLQKARRTLREQADKEELLKVIENAEEKLLQETSYEEDSVLQLKQELEKAREVADNPNVSQEAVTIQTNALVSAINALKKKQPGGNDGNGSGSGDVSEIRVFFTLVGMERGGSQKQTWIARETHYVPQGSNVRYVFERSLKAKNIEFENPSGNYVTSIKSPIDNEWMSEFTNGKYSGWMYMVNGKHPLLGLDEYVLSAEDEIVWHYTNDYRNEEGSEPWNTGDSSGGGSSSGDTKIKLETLNGVVKAELSDSFKKLLKLSIQEVENSEKPTVFIDMRTEEPAREVQLALDAEVLDLLAQQQKLSLGIKSGVLDLTLDAKALEVVRKAQASAKTNVDINLKNFNNFEALLKQGAIKADEEAMKEIRELIGSRPVFEITFKTKQAEISDYKGGQIEVKLPYTLQAGESKEDLTVYRIEEDGSLVEVKSSYDAIAKIMSFTTDHLSFYAVGKKKAEVVEVKIPTFEDVPEGAWYHKAVYELAKEGIVNGKEANRFYPNDKVTRAEFVTLLAKHAKEEAASSKASTFKDVSQDDWYYNAVMWAYEKGIVKGYGEEFKPERNISREEMTVMLLNYARYKLDILFSEEAYPLTFKDKDEIQPWAFEAVTAMAKLEVVKGQENNMFKPKAPATRAEAAQMVYQLLRK